MGIAETIDISRWDAGEVALLGLGLAVLFVVISYGIAWGWRRFIDSRRRG